MSNKNTSWIMRQASGKYAETVLYAISFAESSFFPLPPDPILISLCVLNKEKIIRYTILCTLFSVIGGILGYFIGYSLFDSFGRKILAFYNYETKFAQVTTQFNKWAFWIIALKGLTPIPFKIITIASGVSHVKIFTFLVASIIARSFRFIVVATLCYFWGSEVKGILEKYQKTSLIAILGVTFLGIILLFFI